MNASFKTWSCGSAIVQILELFRKEPLGLKSPIEFEKIFHPNLE